MVNRSFRDDQKVMALLDDIYFGWPPNKVGGVYVAIEEASQTHAHGDKTKVWNAFGVQPPGPGCQRGKKMLGTLFWGHLDFVRRHFVELSMEPCPFGPIVFEGGQKQQWQSTNDAGEECYGRFSKSTSLEVDQDTHDVATLFVAFGGLGLRSVERTKHSAKWANQADCMPIRHLDVVERFAVFLEKHPDTPYVSEATAAARSFRGVMDSTTMGGEEKEEGRLAARSTPRVEGHFRDAHIFPQMEAPRNASALRRIWGRIVVHVLPHQSRHNVQFWARFSFWGALGCGCLSSRTCRWPPPHCARAGFWAATVRFGERSCIGLPRGTGGPSLILMWSDGCGWFSFVWRHRG